MAEIEKAFTKAAKEVKSSKGKRGKVEFDGGLDYESFALAPDSEVVTLAGEAVKAAGLTPRTEISNAVSTRISCINTASRASRSLRTDADSHGRRNAGFGRLSHGVPNRADLATVS